MDRDKFEAFLAAINGNKYDIEAWHGMLRVIYNEKVEHYRDSVYERLVNVFPTSGKFWRIYIEHEVIFEVTKNVEEVIFHRFLKLQIRGRNFERVEKLFQRALLKVLNIELWKIYLTYIRDTKASLDNYK